jgi:hypothetical protein
MCKDHQPKNQETDMKRLYQLTLFLLTVVSGEVYSQEQSLTRHETDRIDSVSPRSDEDHNRYQKEKDEDQLDLLKDEVRRTREETREARRIERRQSAEMREAKRALKAERKAQHSRKRADRLSSKAVDD